MHDKERELAILAERYRTYETIEQHAITRTKQEMLQLIKVLKEECEQRHWLLTRDQLHETWRNNTVQRYGERTG